jgi:hypothetical protein
VYNPAHRWPIVERRAGQVPEPREGQQGGTWPGANAHRRIRTPLVAPTFHLQSGNRSGYVLALDAPIHLRWFEVRLLRCASLSSSSSTQLARCLQQISQSSTFFPRLTRLVSLRATRLPLTGNPSIVTRNSFLLLGLLSFTRRLRRATQPLSFALDFFSMPLPHFNCC